MPKHKDEQQGRSDKARKPAVLFLCVQNAGRSQMAAAWLKHLGGDAVEVYSGGSEPASEVNPTAVQVMAEAGIDLSAQIPKAWTDDVVKRADVVITMGCGDVCPVYSAKRYEDWPVADPKDQSTETVRSIRDEIEGRVRRLLAGLGSTAGV